MARIITFFLFLLLASGVLSRSNDISLDSLATWNGEKTIRVVSRVPDLVDETEFLALLGRLSMRGYDVKFVGAEYSGEGLVLEASETGGEVIISIKAPGSPKLLSRGISSAPQNRGRSTIFRLSPEKHWYCRQTFTLRKLKRCPFQVVEMALKFYFFQIPL